jgi:hypothetical protein
MNNGHNIFNAFCGGAETWEITEVLRRIETRIWEAYCAEPGTPRYTPDGKLTEPFHEMPYELAYGQAYDLVKGIREKIEAEDN